MSERRLTPADYARGVLSGDRRRVAKAITLLESVKPDDVELGRAVLEALVPETGGSIRVGITGPPGVGKSSLIEALGLQLLEKGHRLAVLAVDPTSPKTGGSILGDKTRMVRLSREEGAFIRPSPSGGRLGGLAHRTREALLVCEAAGYDVVIVETMGVGQSEVELASMVDFFTVLVQPGGGDELQGLKRGVLELADALLVNKADGHLEDLAEETRREYEHALRLLRGPDEPWTPRVVAVSAHTGRGLLEFWETVLGHRRVLQASGELETRRRRQDQSWMWRLVEDGLLAAFRGDAEVKRLRPALERDVEEHRRTAPEAARELLERFLGRRGRTRRKG
jgi:LAO/AO transport system kinase